MRRCGVASREAYVLAAHGHGAEAVAETLRSVRGGTEVWSREGTRFAAVAKEHPNDFPRALREAAAKAGLDGEAILLQAVRVAGRLNGGDIVPALADDHRYCAESNKKEPRRIPSTLNLYDCINCDLCIAACPNDAIFAYKATPVETPTECLYLRPGGKLERAPGKGFAIRERHQLAVIGSLCNECSNCEVYCPEEGAPFNIKERVFVTLEAFHSAGARDGFCRHDNILHARLYRLAMLFLTVTDDNRSFVRSDSFHLQLTWEPFAVQEGNLMGSGEVSLDSALLWRMKTVWECIFNSSRPSMVNPDPPSARMERPPRDGMRVADGV
jgi:ferredoxin